MRERLNLLRGHRRFFTAYRGRFGEIALKVTHLLVQEGVAVDEDALRKQTLALYDHLFSVEAHTPTLHELEHAFHQLEAHGISLTVLLNKLFAVMLHDFVRYAIRTGTVVLPLHQLSGIMSAVLALIDNLEESPLEDVIDEEQGRIYRLLAEHNDQLLGLESLYQGVPLSMSVLFIAREGDQALLQAVDERQPALEVGHEVMLGAPFLERPLMAEVEQVDRNRHEFRLGRFHYAAHTAVDRSALRVQPREPMPLVVNHGEHRIEGQVIDISLSGMAIAVDDPADLAEGSTISIELTLPHHGEPERVVVRGRVNRVTPRRNSHRIGVALLDGGESGGLLGEYLIGRQAEVLRHINDLSSDEESETRRRRRTPAAEWPWFRHLVALLVAASLGMVGLLIYLNQPGDEGGLEWEATRDWLSQQKKCQELATQVNLQPTDANRLRLDRCQQELEQIGRGGANSQQR